MSDMAHKMERVALNPWFALVGRTAMVVTLPVLGYLLTNLVTLMADLRVMTVKLDAMKILVESQAAGRYTTADAVRDQQIIELKIDNLRQRLDRQEREARQQPMMMRK